MLSPDPDEVEPRSAFARRVPDANLPDEETTQLIESPWVEPMSDEALHAPKTEHHEGKATRLVPIFPELLPYLRDAFDPANVKVITIAEDATKNFRTRFARYIEKAGLKQWPKLFQNLRATRQTELADSFPAHVVCEWMGNSQPVANKHYLHTTDEHFDRAVSELACSAAPALQNPSEPVRIASQEIAPRKRKSPVSQGNPTKQGAFGNQKVGDEGLEPPTSTV